MLKRLCILLSVYGILILNNFRFIKANDVNYSDGNYSMGEQLPLEETGAPNQPCNPSPCGPNSLCKVVRKNAVCSCQPGKIGSPPSCRTECVVSEECPLQQACVLDKCLDPCPGYCGINAECQVVNHNPICRCRPEQTGDPLIRCVPTTESPDKTCSPTSCGPNTVCRIVDERAVCACPPGQIGVPPVCKPECEVDAECPLEQSCLNKKCADPCQDICGIDAVCVASKNFLVCNCISGYTGDPYTRCFPNSAFQEAVESAVFKDANNKPVPISNRFNG